VPYDLNSLSPMKRAWIMHNSNIPERFFGWGKEDIQRDLGVFPKEVEHWLTQALSGKIIKCQGGLGTTGVGLGFDGPPGRGKTTHAVTTIMEFIRNLPEDEEEIAKILGYKLEDLSRKCRPIYYLTFPDLFNRKKAIFDARDEERQRLIDEMEGLHGRAKDDRLNVRILVLDDLGKEYGSTFNDAAFDEILRSRYDKAIPNIVTTNVLIENWGKQYKDAMGSFAYEAFRQVTLDNRTDLRRSN